MDVAVLCVMWRQKWLQLMSVVFTLHIALTQYFLATHHPHHLPLYLNAFGISIASIKLS